MPRLFRSNPFIRFTPVPLALAFLVLLASPALALSAPTSQLVPSQLAPVQLKVMTSIAPVYALAASVMKGAGSPHILVRPNQSPHDYVMRPSDAQRLSDAQVVFWIGEELEPFLARPLKNIAPQAEHIRLLDTPGLTLLPAQTHHDHQSDQINLAPHIEAVDPHIWLDTDNAILIIQAMVAKFGALDPSRVALYAKNAQDLIEELQKIDAQLAEQLTLLQDRPYFTFHSAYQYFERRYGLRAQGIVNLRPDLSIGPKALNDLRTKAHALPKFCVFMEPEFDQHTTRKYFVGTPAQFAQLDPLGANLGLSENSFPTLLENMGSSMQGCLSQLARPSPRS
ncbi:MAG: zinc ABC transporter substrate-binding protein [Parvibaculaceae bacterium]|nr:zinc ABC transporter substrate-binding protein [Parvibaculaceae bacterium]